MDHKRHLNHLTISGKINILDQVDAYIGTHVEQASQLRPSVQTFLQASEVIGTGICTCCIIHPSM
jgi:hypothetical protein